MMKVIAVIVTTLILTPAAFAGVPSGLQFAKDYQRWYNARHTGERLVTVVCLNSILRNGKRYWPCAVQDKMVGIPLICIVGVLDRTYHIYSTQFISCGAFRKQSGFVA